MEGAALFGGLAAIERNARRRRAYARLAEVEARHAARFALELARAGVALPPFAPSWRTRLLLALARWFGTVSVLPRIALLERADARGYRLDDDELAPYVEERANAEWLAAFAASEAAEATKRLVLRGRRLVIAALGAVLFAASVALARNAQLEGLVFGLLAGVVVGPVTHYLLGKVAVPLAAGRVWCGWACWTAAVLDQLPYGNGGGWLTGRVRHLNLAVLLLSAAVVAALVLVAGYGEGAVGAHAVVWFVAGNVVYWTVGIALALRLRDNRAFCKYVCPVAALLRVTSRPALVKIAGDTAACDACRSKACRTQCPMQVDVPAYVSSARRVASRECVMCLHCVAVCPPNTLAPTVAFDLTTTEFLWERGETR